MESGVRKGRRPPQWYQDEPPSHPLDGFYLRSFWDLNTERKYEFGAIPWGCIAEYGYKQGVDSDNIDMFIALIRSMDAAFLERIKQDLDRQRNLQQQD